MRQHGYTADSQLIFWMGFTMLVLIVMFAAFVWALLWIGVAWWIVAIIVIGVCAFQYFMSDRMVLSASSAKIVTAEQEPILHGIIERLAAMMDMPKPKKIAVIETGAPNTFATGRNPANAVIVVTRGLLRRLNDKELEAVLAHELTHVQNRDIAVMALVSIIIVITSYLISVISWIGSVAESESLENRARRDFYRQNIDGSINMTRGSFMPVLDLMILLLVMLVYVVMYVFHLIGQIPTLALSRYREYAADSGSAMLTGAPTQLASALQKISDTANSVPQEDLRKMQAANALFIVPVHKRKRIWDLFSSHPRVEKRISRLHDMQRDLERETGEV